MKLNIAITENIIKRVLFLTIIIIIIIYNTMNTMIGENRLKEIP